MVVFALLNRLCHGPAWLTFVVTGIAASGLALSSFNLLFLFQSNYHLLFTTARWPRSTGVFCNSSNWSPGVMSRLPATSLSRAVLKAS